MALLESEARPQQSSLLIRQASMKRLALSERQTAKTLWASETLTLLYLERTRREEQSWASSPRNQLAMTSR
ncbi:hypothetical protein GUITHDRAFT_151751 [Guillardia theta CCMP2712]|uniref:Uncharacterized protein n=1 Tax=Guillardia theta (strain CCMP2712) TaxID=905079 RepID=L1JIX8_GUITC|nr:hypothetical protein GUITHDRAFT_151751 [Guillardia theta CCMP2712]EKX48446.1 hypothetical protein GUITHDRAFT_151751 [Guillardia theta CCMP2712]|eukprot:XP_005835426.1 hypothetical protein GUITHDRAFT_151751 [Guillardia theta CCMP2712]